MNNYQAFLEKLRQRGYRITPQREMIVNAIAHSDRHMTAEGIFDAIQPRSKALNLTTIYRTLDLLVEVGLVSRSDLGNGRTMYTSDQHGPHLHLVCRQCGCVTDAGPTLLAAIDEQLQASFGFDADLQHVSISGLCKFCQTPS
jgi:Fur family transcriptional regulator, ferric uptake regulator